MSRHLRIAFAVVAIVCFAVPVGADELQISSSPPPAGQTRSWNVDGATFSGDDVLRLFEGLHKALDQKDTSIHVTLTDKKAADMPSFDPKWHCPDATMQNDVPQIAVWIEESSAKNVALFRTALEACIFEGLAQTGYGGAPWKALYDRFAAEDAALGTNAPDPIVNRRKLGVQLSQFYDAVLSGKLVPSPSPSPQ